ncbi:MAG: hypothetical protein WB995_19815, partial [Candidatus Acidiferrales bacterium]
VAKSQKPAGKVFLNIPYDEKFERLFLAYVCGVTAFGLIPRAALEIPSSTRRLDRILDLLKTCRYSIHDLSRVELDLHRPPTPRFNMPFELGLAVAHAGILTGLKHEWYVCEAVGRRLSKSLSDLDGTDPQIHGGVVDGVFKALTNIFVRQNRQPSVPQMRTVYREVLKQLPILTLHAGAQSLYSARMFRDIRVIASDFADQTVT